jgi:hypothetical protein
MLLKPGVRSRPRTQARSHGAGSRSTARRGLRVTVLAVAGLAACGGRTDLEVEPRRGTPSDAKRCERDADCRGTVDGAVAVSSLRLRACVWWGAGQRGSRRMHHGSKRRVHGPVTSNRDL